MSPSPARRRVAGTGALVTGSHLPTLRAQDDRAEPVAAAPGSLHAVPDRLDAAPDRLDTVRRLAVHQPALTGHPVPAGGTGSGDDPHSSALYDDHLHRAPEERA
ncbi:hypothetical protein ACIBBD_31250 [Streptomyces sp. NPDC051315]|uniref:hypothetical protein n=1 Tax=Streptomyces sp. NPDC051315 TaxID=3365650 RepID=UPI00378C8BCA